MAFRNLLPGCSEVLRTLVRLVCWTWLHQVSLCSKTSGWLGHWGINQDHARPFEVITRSEAGGLSTTERAPSTFHSVAGLCPTMHDTSWTCCSFVGDGPQEISKL